jgi:trimeric autotransporter adhesin
MAVNPPPDGGYPGGNTAEGQAALLSLTTGTYNTAIGVYSLLSIADGSFCTGVGAGSLFANIADENTATGAGALFSNTMGNGNTANGAFALFSNTGSPSNSDTPIGDVFGSFNTANGDRALFSNITGNSNTALGASALSNNTTGGGNTGVGAGALENNTGGIINTALGYLAGLNANGNGNVCIGANVQGEPGVNDSTYIRNVNTLTQNFSAGVNDYVTVRLSDGRLGHTAVVSSQRYKEKIKPLAAASEVLYALKPVSFRLKKEYDETQAIGFGLIAEEVEKVDPTLVYRNGKDQAESVRYEMVNAMLLNEFLKEHSRVEEQDRKIQKQEETITQLQKNVAALAARLRDHDSEIQKVTDQLY